jgi:hypothetical protein
MKSSSSLLGAGALALSLSGCFISSDSDDGAVIVLPASGALTVTWSIDMSQDPGVCSFYGADAFELVVYDDFDRLAAETIAPCERFSVTLDLPDGFYSADATMIDFADRPVTTTRTVHDIDVRAGSELVIDVDFPLGSLL